MSKYVMSDLHGGYDRFLKMLDLIEFKDTDELYILGDIFDRGKKPLEILDYIVSHRNISLIKGNHEQLFEEYFESGDISLWYQNEGEITSIGILQRGYDYEYWLYRYIKKLPLIKVVDNFILVHAGLYLPKNLNDLSLEQLLELQEEEINLWTKSHVYSDKKYKDYMIVCGHNTVQSIIENNPDPRIIHRKGHIFIDCGCETDEDNGKLACLRLDDMEEFYLQ